MSNKQWNNIPIRVFYKRWCEEGGKIFPVSTTRDDFAKRLSSSCKLKANIYKYTVDDGRVQLEEGYEDVDNLNLYIRNKFKQYTREDGILLDIEVIV